MLLLALIPLSFADYWLVTIKSVPVNAVSWMRVNNCRRAAHFRSLETDV